MIDFAADDAPVAGFRRLQASAKEDLPSRRIARPQPRPGKSIPGSAMSEESGLADDQHEGRNVVAETNRVGPSS